MPRKTVVAVPKELIDPFRTRLEPANLADTGVFDAPNDIKAAVDEFASLRRQAAEIERKLEALEPKVLEHCRQVHATRALQGLYGGFKLFGTTGKVTFVMRSNGGQLAESERTGFAERFGVETANELLRRDFSAFKFNPKVLEANYSDVVAALNHLPREVVSTLIIPAGFKATEGALERVAQSTKDAKVFREMISALKLSSFVTAGG